MGASASTAQAAQAGDLKRVGIDGASYRGVGLGNGRCAAHETVVLRYLRVHRIAQGHAELNRHACTTRIARL